MKKGTIYTLLLGVVLMFATACNKEDIKPNATHSQGVKELDNGIIPEGSNLKAINEWGEIITDATGDDMIELFIEFSDEWTSNFRLSEANFDVLGNVSGMVSYGFFPANTGELIVFALDEDGVVLTDTCYQANSSGGTVLSLADAREDIDSAKIVGSDHPQYIVFEKGILDDLLAQSGATGLSISNGYTLVNDRYQVDLVIRAYKSNGDEIVGGESTASRGGKGCGHWINVGDPTPILQWVPCAEEQLAALQAMIDSIVNIPS